MAEAAVSSTEHTLENQQLGGLQMRVIVICTLIQMCDGYDVGSIGWSVPQLTQAWHLSPRAFAIAFLWSNVGVLVGALLAGPIGDRVGRKPLLIGSIAIFGIASLASAFSHELGFLAATRFFTGFGIAGGFAGTTALTGDYSPARLRAALIMVTFTGAPLGGFVGGLVVSYLLHLGFNWPIIFIIGGVFPLALVLVMVLWLPESPRFLAAKSHLSERDRTLLRRLDIEHIAGQPHAVDLPVGNPIAMLFGEGYATRTILLWIIFFCSLLNLFLFVFWLPEILHLTGMTPSQAVFATSLHTLGAICAVLYLGYLIDKFGPQRALAANFAVGIVFIALLALAAMPYLALLLVIFLSGATVIGSQTGSNAACGAIYPARMRTSGIGWALGVGRLGGIAAAPLGGYLLSRGLAPREVFLSALVFALIAAVCAALLGVGGKRTALAMESRAAQ
jgi:MFS transporter, AAHS family, 4-hydroxybenzoate transporter